MLTISHRGFCRQATENTLEAFADAVRVGVDGIETDIRITTDGRLVLFHGRHTATGQAVRDLAYADLCATVGHCVPTLEDALQRYDQLLWVLELKDAGAVEPFIGAIKPYLTSRRLLVISFWHNVMEQVQRQLDVECGVLVAHRPANLQASQLGRWHTIVWKYEFIDRELMEESIANGHRNMVFDVDGVDEHRTCFELGLDGVITDQPLLVAAGANPSR